MIPKDVKKLKSSDPLNFEDIVDRGDVCIKVKEQWYTSHTVRVVTNLALKHSGQVWRIFRVEEGIWYKFDRLSEEWIEEENNG